MHLKNLTSTLRSWAIVSAIGLSSIGAVAQTSAEDFLMSSNLGYFTSTHKTKAGMIATTSRGTEIYLVGNNNQLTPLITGPGAGMYINVSADGRYVGYKMINAKLQQAPAIYDITTGTVKMLENYVDQCGQVSFANDGTMAYTVGNKLIIRKGNDKQTFDLGFYVNIANINPEATKVAFNNIDGVPFIFDIASGTMEEVPMTSTYRPVWSPDGSKLAFQTMDAQVNTLDLATKRTYKLGNANDIAWTADSKSLVITPDENAKGEKFMGAMVQKIAFDGSSRQTLMADNEDKPTSVMVDGNEITISYARGDRSIQKVSYNSGIRAGAPAKRVKMMAPTAKQKLGEKVTRTFTRPDWEHMTPEEAAIKNEEILKAGSRAPQKANDIGFTAIPYINQVYNTPLIGGNYNYGYVCCAPTSSCMMLGYYGLISKGNGKTAAYGVRPSAYSQCISQTYTSKTGYTFNKAVNAGGYWGYSYGVTGGHGYMWGYGSPASMMANFHKNNGVSNSYFESSVSAMSRECNANRPYIICLNNGTGGHVVCVFRCHQAATSTTAAVSKTGSFICHDPYGDYNGANYPNWDGRYSTYDLPGYSNGHANIGAFYWGCVTIATVTPTASSSLSADPGALNFKCQLNEHPSITFKVNAKDINGNITVGSVTPGRFSTNVTSLPSTGGNVTVTFAISDKVGTYGEGGTAQNYNFNIHLTAKGKDGKSLDVRVPISATVTAPPLSGITEKWVISQKRNNLESKGYDASKIRNFVYNNGKLYCVYNHSQILVLNAQTGEKLGFLSNGSVVGPGTLPLCDVKVIDNVIVACNIGTLSDTDESKRALRVYAWEKDNADPYLLFTTTDFQGCNRIGDCLEMTGNFASDLWLAFGADENGQTRIVEYNRLNGTWKAKNTPVYGSNGKNYECLSTVRCYPKGSGWWVDGKRSQPAWCTWDASKQGAVVQTNCGVGDQPRGSSHHEFYWKGGKYALNLIFQDADGTDAKMRVIQDHTGNFSSTSEIGQYPSDGLGNGSFKNTNATGDCMFHTDEDSYLELWTLSTGHGLAYFTTGNVPTITPDPIQPAGPSISTNKTSLSFSVTEGETGSQTIQVTGANLTGDIDARITGNDAHLFTVTPASFKGSSTISVTYAPTAQGSHSATLTLSSDGATNVNVALTGKATQLVTLNDNITADKVEKAWVYSTNEGVGPWYVADANSPYVRDIAADNQTSDGQAVYAMKVKGWGAVAVEKIDVFTGKKLSDLKVDGITGGTFKLGSVCVIDGKLYASNACTAAQPHIVYRWDNDASTPVKVLDVAGNGHVGGLGSRMSFVGTGSTGRLYFTSNGSSLIYYEMNNGVINATPKQLKLTDADGKEYVYSDAGNDTYGAAEVHSNGDGTLWVTSMKAAPKRFDANGKMVETMGLSLASVYGSGMKTFNIGEKRYALVADFEKTNINGKMSIVNVTNGFSGKDAIATLPANGLGTAGNAQRSTTVQYLHNDNNHVVFMLVNVPNQGVACYKYNGRVAGQTGVDEITIDSIDPNAPVEYYNLQGVKVNVDNLIPGLYIRRQENKTDKVLIK